MVRHRRNENCGFTSMKRIWPATWFAILLLVTARSQYQKVTPLAQGVFRRKGEADWRSQVLNRGQRPNASEHRIGLIDPLDLWLDNVAGSG